MKRIVLFGIILAGVVIILLGNYTWNHKVEKTVQEAEEKMSSPMYKEALKVDSNAKATDKNDENGSSSTSTAETQKNNAEDSKNQSETTTQEEATTPNGLEKPTLEAIKGDYYTLFNELEAQETSKIDQLIVQAKADYVSKKTPLSDLIVKYQDAANFMERNADKTFNTIYQQLQYDLERNGYSKDEAEEFKQTYNAKKAARTSRILSQIKDF